MATPALGIIGAFVGAALVGLEYKEKKAEAKLEEEVAGINVELVQEDIEYVTKQTEKEVGRFREAGEAFKGTQRAVIGRSAAKMEGTPLMLLQETSAKIEEDVLAIKEYGAHERRRLGMQKEQYELMGEYYKGVAGQAWLTGLLGMGSTFLTGYAQTYGMKGWPTFGQRKKKDYYGSDPWRLGGY